MVAHFVYFLGHPTGKTLYVGRSINPKGRWRIHQKRIDPELQIRALVSCNSLEEAQELELSAIVQLKPVYNIRVASSPTRLGFKNSPEHTAALIRGLREKGFTKEAGARRWETRSRAPEDNPFYGRAHNKATVEAIKKATTKQFEDPVKRERHRQGILRSLEERRKLGKKFGRANKH